MSWFDSESGLPVAVMVFVCLFKVIVAWNFVVRCLSGPSTKTPMEWREDYEDRRK